MSDLNLNYGTVTDGGSSAAMEFSNPSYANDNSIGTVSISVNLVKGAGTWYRRIKADLSTNMIVNGMTVYYASPTVILEKLEYSDDGSTWVDTGLTPDAPYTDLALGSQVQVWPFAGDLIHRYWRLSRTEVNTGLRYLTQVNVQTWVIEGSPVPVAGAATESRRIYIVG